jgi:hypothetical protein
MKVFAIGCIDCRHSGALDKALADYLGLPVNNIYFTRIGGGIGNLASLEGVRTPGLLADIELAIRVAEIQKIIGTVHGTSEHDQRGCAAYADAGHAHQFASVDQSDRFLNDELVTSLNNLHGWLDTHGFGHVEVELVPVTFAEANRNVFGQPIRRQRSAVREQMAAV